MTVERATESASELAVAKLETSSPSTRAAAETAADSLPVSRRAHMTAMSQNLAPYSAMTSIGSREAAAALDTNAPNRRLAEKSRQTAFPIT
jgi:hypothetical protein